MKIERTTVFQALLALISRNEGRNKTQLAGYIQWIMLIFWLFH